MELQQLEIRGTIPEDGNIFNVLDYQIGFIGPDYSRNFQNYFPKEKLSQAYLVKPPGLDQGSGGTLGRFGIPSRTKNLGSLISSLG